MKNYTKRKNYKITIYFHVGLAILILSILLLLLYSNYFEDSMKIIDNYTNDFCTFTITQQTSVNFNCWANGYSNIVTMPCFKIYVQTSNLTNITFYRNYAEKLTALSNKVDVI
jgi:hypothetical protein